METLPWDCLEKITDYLEIKDVKSLKKTNKHLWNEISSNYKQRNLYFRGTNQAAFEKNLKKNGKYLRHRFMHDRCGTEG
jgi:hypothetical protein